MRLAVLGLLLSLGFASTAEACLFGRCRRCVSQRHFVHKAPVVVKEVIAQQPASIVINNAAPQAIVQPGQSAFGYSRSNYEFGRLEPFDPNLALNITARTVVDGLGTLESLIDGGLASNAELARELGNLARISALANALGDTVTESEITVTPGLGIQGNARGAAALARGAEEAILDQVCKQCHGSQLREPKAGIVLDSTQKFNWEQIGHIIETVELGEMPPDSPLNDAEQKLLRHELFERRVE